MRPGNTTVGLRVLGLAGLMLLLSVTETEAQMFGPRQVGSPISPRSGAGATAAPAAGTLRNQRFMRGNRSRANFVGSDRSETRQFVGMQQSIGAGSTRSAVSGAGLGGDLSGQVNQLFPRAGASQLYPPRFEIGYEFDQAAAVTANRATAAQLTRRLNRLSETIEVSVANRVATLRGEVASADLRQTAEILVGFEPGISVVRNELQVAGDSPTIPPPPPTPTPLPR